MPFGACQFAQPLIVVFERFPIVNGNVHVIKNECDENQLDFMAAAHPLKR